MPFLRRHYIRHRCFILISFLTGRSQITCLGKIQLWATIWRSPRGEEAPCHCHVSELKSGSTRHFQEFRNYSPSQQLDCNLMRDPKPEHPAKSFLALWLLESVWENQGLLFQAADFGAICYAAIENACWAQKPCIVYHNSAFTPILLSSQLLIFFEMWFSFSFMAMPHQWNLIFEKNFLEVERLLFSSS